MSVYPIHNYRLIEAPEGVVERPERFGAGDSLSARLTALTGLAIHHGCGDRYCNDPEHLSVANLSDNA